MCGATTGIGYALMQQIAPVTTASCQLKIPRLLMLLAIWSMQHITDLLRVPPDRAVSNIFVRSANLSYRRKMSNSQLLTYSTLCGASTGIGHSLIQ